MGAPGAQGYCGEAGSFPAPFLVAALPLLPALEGKGVGLGLGEALPNVLSGSPAGATVHILSGVYRQWISLGLGGEGS